MILIIDNYDSFVHNIARYVGKLNYPREVHRHDAITIQQITDMNPSHIIISPGPCTPNEAGICLEVITQFAPTIPILGICLGHQAIGQAFGAKITKANQPNHGKNLAINHNQQGIFSNLPKPLTVGLYHSLVIEPTKLPQQLKVTAMSPHQDIMAIKHQNHPCIGIQFHPESILTEHGSTMLQQFLSIYQKPS